MPTSPRLAELLGFVAANVRRLRHGLGLTQEQLVEASGLDLRFLQKVEAAKTNITLDTLLRLADVLQVKPGVLLRAAVLPTPQRGRPPRARTARSGVAPNAAARTKRR